MTEMFVGYAGNGTIQKNLKDTEAVAEFIVENGVKSDITITDELDCLVCNTYGIFINCCPDKDFLRELLKYLVPMQNELM